MKKITIGLALMLGMSVSGGTLAMAQDFSLIVAPARFSVIQVLFDVLDKRPAVLVSYQGEATTINPALHVWSGVTWNPVGMHELRELNFLQRTPQRVIFIGDDALLPVTIRDSLAWMPEVVFLRELDNAALLNDLGRVLRWSNQEWRWFARRYNLQIEDEAAPLRATSWFDQPGPILREETQRYTPAPVGISSWPSAGEPVYDVVPPLERPTDLPPAPPPPPPAPSALDEMIRLLEDPGSPTPEGGSYPIK